MLITGCGGSVYGEWTRLREHSADIVGEWHRDGDTGTAAHRLLRRVHGTAHHGACYAPVPVLTLMSYKTQLQSCQR